MAFPNSFTLIESLDIAYEVTTGSKRLQHVEKAHKGFGMTIF